ncbi:MAG: HRDC domain-containing protein [Comamonadaceae bacterium]|nr:HRDC domain-containing protein [Comamonadaceae bacterium]
MSCIYRCQQAGQRFGAGAPRSTCCAASAPTRSAQFGHDALSHLRHRRRRAPRPQWRSVLRQLIALGHLRTEGEYNTLRADRPARARARAARSRLLLRAAPRRGAASAAASTRHRSWQRRQAAAAAAGRRRRCSASRALKAWRAEVAREHNVPAYVVFHDATLAEMARECPARWTRSARRQRRRREEARGLRCRNSPGVTASNLRCVYSR